MSFSAHKAAAKFLRPPPVGASVHHFFKFSTIRAVRLIAALFWQLIFFSAAGAEIFIEPRVGFHGVFQLGRPFPLEVELTNSGRPAEGLLEVQVWKGGATKGGAPFAVNYRR
ncbi:MAG: hypothetical protein EXR70_07445 [Deltaproteobacteria bacterium]|nr:hypothetical protein [Deltaproteobacteria bacterium]